MDRDTTLLTLPPELLVHIISFVTPLRERMKLRHVSRRLQSACETPSLWREFVWPYYHTDDESCMKNVLKVCGQHVKQLSFPNHVTSTSISVTTLAYCSNVVQLSLPTTKLNSEQLGEILLHMEHLQNLDVRWESDIKQLLELIILYCMNLEELTIREIWLHSIHLRGSGFAKLMEPWIHYWKSSGFVPHKLHIAVVEYTDELFLELEDFLLMESQKSISTSPNSGFGQLMLYTSLTMPMDLVPVLPVFQVEFGQTASLPLVTADICGFSGLNLLLLTDTTHHNKTIYKVSLRQIHPIIHTSHTFTNLDLLTEFNASSCEIYSDQLEQLAITCPNLHRLNLEDSARLKSLQGLHAIASTCHNLQGLNVVGMSAEHIKECTQLWEILSGMKLTHLAIDLCMLLSSVEEDSIKLISYFEKCKSLQALECYAFCSDCTSYFTSGISTISHFPALIYFQYVQCHFPYFPIALHDVVTSCKQLRYVIFAGLFNQQYFLSPCFSYNLQHLSISLVHLSISNDFMSSISSHGRLVCVMFYVRSVTSEGITVLVTNSPNLLKLYVFVDDHKAELLDVETKLKTTMPNRKLFKCGGYQVEEIVSHVATEHAHKSPAELLSFWQ